jgi:hypothetical protein
MQSDYLKYWKVIRQFFKSKYGVTQSDLDMLLFLYSEKLFSKDKFDEYRNVLSWDRKRFERLLNNGWIELFRKGQVKKRSIYRLSYKANKMIDSMYRILNGEEIPTTIGSNPMFKKNVKYTDKVYRNMITQMNQFIRQQRHLSPE